MGLSIIVVIAVEAYAAHDLMANVTIKNYWAIFVFVLYSPWSPGTERFGDVICSPRTVSQVSKYDSRKSFQGVEGIGVLESHSFQVHCTISRPSGTEGIFLEDIPA